MGCMSEELGFHSWQGRKFLSYPQHQNQLEGLSNVLSSGFRGCFRRHKTADV